ncbi:NUDIX domain-containing protein [Pseudolysobacter antarcticus]|uniref:NUDIX domain-containing protein n=1 Tax=Pseudolysobacter antarcticus TaxID=2511995 RepID=A0A411HI60_9GAMM|nr:NUDIX hydrolase [Pseudolysobacter antarcticus]QBB70209.1 NUDIX domain-containing protein [Pseudolysobacter antarcticus]
MNDLRQRLAVAFAKYADDYPDEPDAGEFVLFLAGNAPVFSRANLQGHFTGSAWLVSADGARVLLTHHRKLGRWLQLGGHADGDEDLARVALREAEEESGLSDLIIADPHIFDIDRHSIPARGDEPGHWHYDVRFVVRATGSEKFALSEESLELAWLSIESIAADGDADISLRRMAQKWLRRSVQ